MTNKELNKLKKEYINYENKTMGGKKPLLNKVGQYELQKISIEYYKDMIEKINNKMGLKLKTDGTKKELTKQLINLEFDKEGIFEIKAIVYCYFVKYFWLI